MRNDKPRVESERMRLCNGALMLRVGVILAHGHASVNHATQPSGSTRFVLDTRLRRCQKTVMACYTYILRCADGRFYYGSTGDLSRRLAEHREGLCPFTSSRRPVTLVYYETFETTTQARQRERSFKNGRTRRKRIEQLIRDFPAERLALFA